ncbi:minichromosome maintenance protein MCM [Haloarcula onubensis]|uniref:Minichromosome maintenance protein MCM n=1 Tax=Haloarcula onubensis TaxID=2950539 RepID=A0ABU2FWZ7_9EURY|nr:minichromosome maintenance protein MCM [Halomicroarcula sp. S3CR25-11]MDS0284767.1 minichromosome maintenance protein MCM [Halomicroarcula sp. S3CR25-11]
MSSIAIDDQNAELVDTFQEFYRNYYRDEVGQLLNKYPKDQQSLFIEAHDLYRKEPALLEDWKAKPSQLRSYAEEALELYDAPVDIDLEGVNVRLTDNHDTLRRRQVTEIQPDDVGNLAAFTGQIARVTQKSPRLEEAAHICQRCGTVTRIPQTRNEVQEPHECQGCERQGPFKLDHAESEFRNQRKIKLEEPIEARSQARGQSVPVYVEGDLCDYGPGDTTLPDHAGEKATIVGVVRVDESQFSGRNAAPESEYWIDAQAIAFESDDGADVDIEAHREEFEALADEDDALDLVAESLAPSLHADEEDDLYTARRACAAWLFNAYRLDPPGAESKRGDLHMCLIGDPGTGKSTLMSYIADILPKSEFRTGTGLSEVGLTAATVQEEFAGTTEWTLQPGILPRADGGHCLIDEVDGVIDESTKAIHDALEGDQMVKTDKAGISADLPTRCALLAGGNPTYTRFDKYEPIPEQVDLDPALFDRMDLVFALEDTVDTERDAAKAGHALDAWDDLSRAEIASQAGPTAEEDETVDAAVQPDVLTAWVAHARQEVYPTLTQEAKTALQEFYVEVRNLNDGDEDSAIPATPRTLEAGIRLSIAIARLHLSDSVTMDHVDRAIELTREVVGLRYDPETGEFDDAATSGGTTKAQQDRIKTVQSIIESAAEEYDDGAPIDVVIERAEDDGISEEKTEHEIQKLRERGDVYEPRTDHLRTS